MVLMGYLGGKEMLSNSQRSLSQRLTLEVDLLACFCIYAQDMFQCVAQCVYILVVFRIRAVRF